MVYFEWQVWTDFAFFLCLQIWCIIWEIERDGVVVLIEIQIEPAHTLMWSQSLRMEASAYVIQYASSFIQINQHPQSFNKTPCIIDHDKCCRPIGCLWERALSSTTPCQQHWGISYHAIPLPPPSIPPSLTPASTHYYHPLCTHPFEVIQ